MNTNIDQLEKELTDQRAKVAALEEQIAKAKKENIEIGDYVVMVTEFTAPVAGAQKGTVHKVTDLSNGLSAGNIIKNWHKSHFRKATTDEIFVHLKKEAAEKGFNVGAKVKWDRVWNGVNNKRQGEEIKNFRLNKEYEDGFNGEYAKKEKIFLVAELMTCGSLPVDYVTLDEGDINIIVDGKVYKAEVIKDEGIVKFGCAIISFNIFRDIRKLMELTYLAGNRQITAVQIGKGLFDRELIDKIVKRIDAAS